MFLKISSTSSTALRRLAARGIDQGGNISPPSHATTFNHALIPPPPGSCHCVCPLRGFPAPDWITDSDDRGQVSHHPSLPPSRRRWNPSRLLPPPSPHQHFKSTQASHERRASGRSREVVASWLLVRKCAQPKFEISVIFEFRGDEYLMRKRGNPRKIRWCRYCDSIKHVPVMIFRVPGPHIQRSLCKWLRAGLK